MAGNNFKESLKSQFRDAFGEQPRHLATRPAPEVIRPGEEEPHRDMAKGLGEDPTEVKPAPSETMPAPHRGPKQCPLLPQRLRDTPVRYWLYTRKSLKGEVVKSVW